MADLQGQRVGVESGSISHFVLLRALEQAGLSETDVEIVHTGVHEAIDAIERGTVDAAVVWEPVMSRYERTAGRTPIFTSAAIPNEVVDVLVVRPELVEQRADDLVNLVRGWDSAVQRWRANEPDVSQAIADGLNTDLADLRQEFTTVELIDLERNRRLLDLNSPASIQPTFEHMVQFLQATNQLEATSPAAAELVNDRIVKRAMLQEQTPPE
jgi:NitT/TauT family transport system substrate-binding protein